MESRFRSPPEMPTWWPIASPRPITVSAHFPSPTWRSAAATLASADFCLVS
jgi:hypothetical protein